MGFEKLISLMITLVVGVQVQSELIKQMRGKGILENSGSFIMLQKDNRSVEERVAESIEGLNG